VNLGRRQALVRAVKKVAKQKPRRGKPAARRR